MTICFVIVAMIHHDTHDDTHTHTHTHTHTRVLCRCNHKGYISRSVAGSFDNEGIAIFALIITYFLWVRSVKTGSLFWGASTALAYFYMVAAWGGYVFIINLIPMHAFFLLLTGRYSSRLYIAYSSFYSIGTLLSMQVRFVGFQPVQSGEHMAALGVFGLLQLYAGVLWVKSLLSPEDFNKVFKFAVVSFLSVFGIAALIGTATGYITPFTGRFYSLLDPTYAKIHIPIIASVSEHQPTTWASFFFDLHFLVFLIPAGFYYCFKELNDATMFPILYGATSVYFSVLFFNQQQPTTNYPTNNKLPNQQPTTNYPTATNNKLPNQQPTTNYPTNNQQQTNNVCLSIGNYLILLYVYRV
jgi:asparagine N-glycosylation enzyme membrane subunit Stt3